MVAVGVAAPIELRTALGSVGVSSFKRILKKNFPSGGEIPVPVTHQNSERIYD